MYKDENRDYNYEIYKAYMEVERLASNMQCNGNYNNNLLSIIYNDTI